MHRCRPLTDKQDRFYTTDMHATITAFGAYVPERRVTNDELAQSVDTSDEWIQSHTGIRERRIAAPDEAASDLELRRHAPHWNGGALARRLWIW